MSLQYEPSNTVKKIQNFLIFVVISILISVFIPLATWVFTDVSFNDKFLTIIKTSSIVLSALLLLMLHIKVRREKKEKKDFMDLLVVHKKEELKESLGSVLLSEESKKLIEKHLESR